MITTKNKKDDASGDKRCTAVIHWKVSWFKPQLVTSMEDSNPGCAKLYFIIHD